VWWVGLANWARCGNWDLQFDEWEASEADVKGASLENCAMGSHHRNKSRVLMKKQKEKEFYTRIKKYRVDPSASSMANPVPDYYGERISSVQGYRQWLKDQRAFNKKRQTFV
jgi:import inner membrane translocase subunit TIM23